MYGDMSPDCLDELDILVCAMLETGLISPWESMRVLAHQPEQRCEDIVNAIMEITANDELYTAIVTGYHTDPWCQKALGVKMDDLT